MKRKIVDSLCWILLIAEAIIGIIGIYSIVMWTIGYSFQPSECHIITKQENIPSWYHEKKLNI